MEELLVLNNPCKNGNILMHSLTQNHSPIEILKKA